MGSPVFEVQAEHRGVHDGGAGVAWPLAAGTLRPLLDEELATFDFIFAEKE